MVRLRICGIIEAFRAVAFIPLARNAIAAIPNGQMLYDRWRGIAQERPDEVALRDLASGERWENFRYRHGDWGRGMALWLGRRFGRLSLRELAERAG